jgi:hypothetical protein
VAWTGAEAVADADMDMFLDAVPVTLDMAELAAEAAAPVAEGMDEGTSVMVTPALAHRPCTAVPTSEAHVLVAV